jgi:hypothetical protein
LETELDRSRAFAAEAYAETQRIHGLWLAAETTRNELECKLASKQAELETALDKSRAFAAEAHAETQRIHGLWLAAETTRNELESKLASAAVMTPELQEEIVWLRLYAVLLSEAVDRKHSRRTAVWRATREHFQKAKQRRLLNSGLQLAWHSDYGLAFDARPVTYDRRIAVISVPKSGTYLLGEILKSIGFLDVGIHGAAWGFQDFRVGSIEEKLSQIAMRTVRLPIEEYVDLIRPGQFVLGHFPHELRVLTAITGFKRILLVRDLRDCFVSYMRYVARLGALSGNAPDWSKLQDKISQMELFAETEGAQFFELVRPLQGWLTDRGTLLVRYEDLMGDHGKTRLAAALKAMVDHIGVFGDGAVPDIARARVVDTLTATGERTNRVEWWSAKVEGRFEELGGTTLNALMGYS